MVSATPSGGWLQSSPTIPELGFCLGSRAQMFWLDEGLPNSLAPGKRPRITLSPSLALRGGEPVLAFGTPGGDQQDQWQLCFWLAHVHAQLFGARMAQRCLNRATVLHGFWEECPIVEAAVPSTVVVLVSPLLCTN